MPHSFSSLFSMIKFDDKDSEAFHLLVNWAILCRTKLAGKATTNKYLLTTSKSEYKLYEGGGRFEIILLAS